MSDALADARAAVNLAAAYLGHAWAPAWRWCWRPSRPCWRWSAFPPTMPASTMPICARWGNWLGPAGRGGGRSARLLQDLRAGGARPFLAHAVRVGSARWPAKSLKICHVAAGGRLFGTTTVAAGVRPGFPHPADCPPVMGGMIGIAASGLSTPRRASMAHALAGLGVAAGAAAGGAAAGLPGHGLARHARPARDHERFPRAPIRALWPLQEAILCPSRGG